MSKAVNIYITLNTELLSERNVPHFITRNYFIPPAVPYCQQRTFYLEVLYYFTDGKKKSLLLRIIPLYGITFIYLFYCEFR